jgi:hypothetical protein
MAPDLLFYPVLNETEALAGHGCSTLFIESVEQHGRGILSDGWKIGFTKEVLSESMSGDRFDWRAP